MIKDRACDKTFLDNWGVRTKHLDVSYTLGAKLGSFEVRNIKPDWINVPENSALFYDGIYVGVPSTKTINLAHDLSINLPFTLDFLSEEINKSKYILDLKSNWDGEGSEPYTIKTLKISIEFIIKFAEFIRDTYSIDMIVPKIYHGPNGSIDLSWSKNDFRLFINIEKDGSKAHFYCDYNKKQVSEGVFDILENYNFIMIPHPISI